MIYVDPIIHYGWKMYGKTVRSCHMFTDGTIEYLHKFAEKIGLKRRWFQNKKNFPHYDLVPSKRKIAVNLGAKEVSLKEMLELTKNKP